MLVVVGAWSRHVVALISGLRTQVDSGGSHNGLSLIEGSRVVILADSWVVVGSPFVLGSHRDGLGVRSKLFMALVVVARPWRLNSHFPRVFGWTDDGSPASSLGGHVVRIVGSHPWSAIGCESVARAHRNALAVTGKRLQVAIVLSRSWQFLDLVRSSLVFPADDSFPSSRL